MGAWSAFAFLSIQVSKPRAVLPPVVLLQRTVSIMLHSCVMTAISIFQAIWLRKWRSHLHTATPKSLENTHYEIIIMTEVDMSFFLVQGLHVLQAASAPPCGLSIVVHTTGTETIMTELSWFLFSFGHHCLSQFWSPFLPPHCKIVKSLLYLYFLLLPWLVKVWMAIIRHFPLKFRYLFIYQLFTICSCVLYFTCSS